MEAEAVPVNKDEPAKLSVSYSWCKCAEPAPPRPNAAPPAVSLSAPVAAWTEYGFGGWRQRGVMAGKSHRCASSVGDRKARATDLGVQATDVPVFPEPLWVGKECA